MVDYGFTVQIAQPKKFQVPRMFNIWRAINQEIDRKSRDQINFLFIFNQYHTDFPAKIFLKNRIWTK